MKKYFILFFLILNGFSNTNIKNVSGWELEKLLGNVKHLLIIQEIPKSKSTGNPSSKSRTIFFPFQWILFNQKGDIVERGASNFSELMYKRTFEVDEENSWIETRFSGTNIFSSKIFRTRYQISNKIEERAFDENSNLLNKTVYEIGLGSDIQISRFYDSNEALIRTTEKRFLNGNTTSERTWGQNSNGSISWEWEKKFDELGNEVEYSTSNGNGAGVKYTTKKKFDLHNNVTEETRFDNGVQVGKNYSKYSYNDLGLLAEYTLFRSDNSLDLIERKTYDSNGRILSFVVIKTKRFADSSYSVLYKYDKKGLKLGEFRYNADDILVSKSIFGYDAIGNEILREDYYGEPFLFWSSLKCNSTLP